MTASWAAPGIRVDEALPGADGLFGEPARLAVASFLGARGWEPSDMRPVQALYRPERECTVRFRVRATRQDGTRRVLSIVAESRARRGRTARVLPEHERRFEVRDPVDSVGPYLVWAYPYDPGIPALPDAAWGPSVRALLPAVPGPRGVSVQPLRYRPRRRAVFRYRVVGGNSRGPRVIYGKALRPSRHRRAMRIAEGLRAGRRRPFRRPRLELAVPTDPTGAGVLLAGQLPGRSLRDILLAGDSLPAPRRLSGLLRDLGDRPIPGGLEDSDQGSGPADIARHAARLVLRLVPEAEADVGRIVDAVEAGAERDAVPPRLIHGDLYEAQVLVDEDFSLGLVDLDDVGPGDPAADAANFTAHLLALALAVPGAARRLLAYRSLVRDAFLRALDLPPRDLAWREALTMMRLALGSFRVLRATWPADVRRGVRLAVRLIEEE